MDKTRFVKNISFSDRERAAEGKGRSRGGVRLAAAYVVKVAVMAAMLTALKFALSFVPNVEVVTLLVMVYAAAFGAAYALPATVIFCAVETAIYGAGSWVVLYFVYWPLLALLSCLAFGKLRRLPLWLSPAAAAFAAVMSAFFGVLSACCDTLYVAVGFPGLDLAAYWTAYYLRGLAFDGVHILSNAIVVGVLFLPLLSAGRRIRRGSARV